MSTIKTFLGEEGHNNGGVERRDINILIIFHKH